MILSVIIDRCPAMIPRSENPGSIAESLRLPKLHIFDFCVKLFVCSRYLFTICLIARSSMTSSLPPGILAPGTSR